VKPSSLSRSMIGRGMFSSARKAIPTRRPLASSCECRLDVILAEVRIGLQQFGERAPFGEPAQNQLDGNARAFDAGFTQHNSRIGRDTRVGHGADYSLTRWQRHRPLGKASVKGQDPGREDRLA
jgi:hypothetical protein